MASVSRRQRLAINLAFRGLDVLHSDPPVYRVAKFVSSSACQELRQAAQTRLRPSTMLHLDEPAGSSNVRAGAARSSDSAYFHHRSVAALLDRSEELIMQPRTHFEYPQVTRYREGQEYTSHLDAIDVTSASSARLAGQGGQRICTLLGYLNTCHTGGATAFESLGLTVAPREGDAVVFFPSFLCGAPDPLLLHSAQPACDEKWVLQLWVRQRPMHAQRSVQPLAPEQLPILPTRLAGRMRQRDPSDS